MSKTDGIGTWVWNVSLDLSVVSPVGDTFIFDFVCNGLSYNSLYINALSVEYGSTPVYSGRTVNGGWSDGGENSPYRRIDIKTAPPADFLPILQANATYQEPKLTDLTGTTWKWKEKLTPTSVDLFWEVSGVSDYFSFSRIDSTYLDSDGGNLLYYLDFDTDIKHLAYTSAVDDVVSEYFPDAIVGWQNEAVKFFSISGGTDAINTDLINYLYANAELQGSAPSEPTYKLRINGTYARMNGKTKGSLTFGGATYKWDNTSAIGGGEPVSGQTVTLNVTDIGAYSWNQCWYAINNGEWVRISKHTSSPITLNNVTNIKFRNFAPAEGITTEGTFDIGTTPDLVDVASLAVGEEIEASLDLPHFFLDFKFELIIEPI